VPEALDNQTGSVAAAVEQIDTTTQAGRDQAIALVRDAFRAGTITADVAKEFVALITAMAPTAPAADAAASALDRLNGSLSDIALIGDVVGKSVDGVFQAIDDAAAAFPRFGDGIRQLIAGLDLSTTDGQSQFRARVKGFASQLAEGGLTDDERGILQFLQGLVGSLPPLTDAATQAAAGVDTLAGSVGGLADTVRDVAGELRNAFADIDTNGAFWASSPGRPTRRSWPVSTEVPGPLHRQATDRPSLEKGIGNAQTVLENAPFGANDPEKDAARLIIPVLRRMLGVGLANLGPSSLVPAGTEQLTSSVKTIRDETGATVAGLLQSEFVLQQDHLPRISAGVEALVAASRTAIGADVPPQIPGFGLGGGGGVIDQSVTVTFEITISGLTVPDGADPDAVGRGIGRGVRSELTGAHVAQLLGTELMHRNLARGGIAVQGTP
jgi:hypothetical protein